MSCGQQIGCYYKLGSCTQTDNEMNIIILHLLEIAGIIENRERRERESKWWYIYNVVSSTQAYYWFIIYFFFLSQLFYI